MRFMRSSFLRYAGLLAVMTVGKDYKSQAWKRYAEQAQAKPRRVVER